MMSKHTLIENGEEVEKTPEEMLNFFESFVEGQSKAVYHYSKQNRELRRENKLLREALEFYADDSSYHRFEQEGFDSEVMGKLIIDVSDVSLPNKIIDDFYGGKRAREVLKKIDKKDKE